MEASGTFKVEMKPIDSYPEAKHEMNFGRMSLDKSFNGDLEASSQGEMISFITRTKGSAGYVAIEQVVGALHGKKGSFALQHFGVMHAGDQRLILEVIPGSGTQELKGIEGKMEIDIKDGQHLYRFDYQISVQ